MKSEVREEKSAVRVKSNSFLRGRGRSDELLDCSENGGEFFVVFFLQTVDLACKIRVSVHQPAKLHKGAHNRDVHLHRSFAIENTREREPRG